MGIIILNFLKNRRFEILLVLLILSGATVIFTKSVVVGRLFSIFFILATGLWFIPILISNWKSAEATIFSRTIIILSLLFLPIGRLKSIYTRSGRPGEWTDISAIVLVILIAVLGLLHYIPGLGVDTRG